jgi:hypothetical protein
MDSQVMKTSNPFLALAKAMWERGEDGEVIAREVAATFKWLSDDGVGIGQDEAEYARLRPQSEVTGSEIHCV